MGRTCGLVWIAFVFTVTACSSPSGEVVVYVAHDRVLAEPVLRRFESETGIRVRAAYDVEANKTVGLANRLLAEAAEPRADVFWNNEVIQTIRLQQRGAVAVEALPAVAFEDPAGVPDPAFRGSEAPASRRPLMADASLRWIGFAARARVLLINTTKLSAEEAGSAARASIRDLADPRWRSRIAVANPHFGTTGTHFAALLAYWGEPEFRRWLRALKENGVAVLPGNAQVRHAVAEGRYAIGLTDTDDAVGALTDGAPVRILFPDQSDGLGVLLIPNTVAMVRGAPRAAAARRLAAYLLSADVESELARGRGAQIPLNHAVDPPKFLPGLRDIRVMSVDFQRAAAHFERMLAVVEEEWNSGAARTRD